MLVNILAALALIGPGLVITNVLVARFDEIRDRNDTERRVKPLITLAYAMFAEYIEMADDFLISIAARAEREGVEPPPTFELPSKGDTLATLKDALSATETVVNQAFESRAPSAKDPDVLPVPDHAVGFPRCYRLLTLVELLDRDIPMPEAVLMAHGLFDYSRTAGVDFLDWYDSRSIYANEGEGNWIIVPKVGFAEIQNSTQPSVRTGIDRRVYGAESYHGAVSKTLSLAHMVLDFMLTDIPERFISAVPDYMR